MKKGAVFAPLVLLFLAFSAFSQTPVNDLAARISESRYKWSTSSTLFQSPRSDIITLQNAAAADGNGTAFDVGSYGGVALQIAGSFTATITFEATIDRSNWIAVKADNLNDRTSATTATAAGLYSVPLSGAVQFRARVSDHSGGTVTVKARGVAGYIGLRQSSGGGGGGSVDSVFGRTGDVVAATNDYTWAQINKTTSSLANITTRSASDLSSGTLAADRGGAGTVNGIMKANGSGVVSAAVSATDYAPATSGSSILKGNGSGGFSNAASGTDYAPATSGSAILKGNGSGGFSAAVSGTDYAAAGAIDSSGLTMTTARILGRTTASTGAIEELTASGVLDVVGSTRGSVLYRGASGWAILTPGTSGRFLKTNGAGADPEWADAAGGGTPGGSDTQLQYNNAGSFGGISGATSDGTNVTFGSGNLRATSPRITTGINDANGNESILLTATGSAVNEITVANAATGNNPVISATGGDTNVGINLTSKGTGGLIATNASASGLIVGPNGTTNPALQVITNVSSQANGLAITPTASGSGVTLGVISPNTNEGLAIVSKGIAGLNVNTGTSGWIDFKQGSTTNIRLQGDAWNFRSGVALNWSSGSTVTVGNDVTLNRNGVSLLGVGTSAIPTGLAITGTGANHGESIKYDSVTTTVSASAGGTITATNLIPAGACVDGVVTRVTTAFGTSNGLTSISVGDGTTANLWSNNSGITLNTTTGSTAWLSSFTPGKLYTAATSVVITGNGGSGFDSTGVIRVTVFYHTLIVPSS